MPGHGPSGGVIRQLPEADADRAFAEHPEERVERGSKGSVSGIRVGSLDAMGTLDVRSAQNLAARAARKGGAPTGPRKPKPLQAPSVVPVVADLEDWELEVGTGAPDPAAVGGTFSTASTAAPSPEPVSASAGDILTRAAHNALTLLAQIPSGMELYVGSQLDPQGVELVMGIGYLVGKSLAHYRGNNHYKISNAGTAAFIEGKV